MNIPTYVLKIKERKNDPAGYPLYVKEYNVNDNCVTTTYEKYSALQLVNGTYAQQLANIINFNSEEHIKVTVVESKCFITSSNEISLAKEVIANLTLNPEYAVICNEKVEIIKDALSRLFAPIKPFAESKQNYICPKCMANINFDALNDNVENAPKFCTQCGQRLDFEVVKNENS